LQRTDREHEKDEPNPIGLEVAYVASRQVAHSEQQREQADRHIDVEHRAPREGVGEPSSEGRSEDGRHHDAEAEDGECLAVLLFREGVEQDGLAQGHERRAANALRQPEDHHAF
jgi:hypothetical protein